ncbi:hypothetical protein [Pedobacter frigoris]|uniref:Uncharacterized protein n=1 Tax=Pedobacter frigoris TaxID=2571272 RepID=A0A4U1CIE8_9SPHI|nr:hypothetical protein [Pedobacter frigoris]TKC05065.1 hypothetical protein FA047_14970 [Pedobacter frigoris]
MSLLFFFIDCILVLKVRNYMIYVNAAGDLVSTTLYLGAIQYDPDEKRNFKTASFGFYGD